MTDDDKVVKGTTCFLEHTRFGIPCVNTDCRCWIRKSDDFNCVNVTTHLGNFLTLQEVGDIFDITRMRVCQIEKNIINKIKVKLVKSDSLP